MSNYNVLLFSILFYRLTGVRTIFISDKKIKITLRASIKEKRRRKGRKIKDSPRTPRFNLWISSGVIHIEVCEISKYWVSSPTHQSYFNRLIFELV